MAPLVLVLCTSLAASLAAAPDATAGCRGANAHPGDLSLKKVRTATHCLVNARRANQGRSRLRGNRKLTRAAVGHSRSMARKDFFSHYSPSGAGVVDRVRRTGYLSGSRSWSVAENIGWGSRSRATPRAMVRAWMRSPGHRSNILSKSFRHIGVGVARGAPAKGYPRAATYTTDFGRR